MGSEEANARHQALFGHDSLFNSGTVAFYSKDLEPEEGYLRFAPEYRDSAEFWNTIHNPYDQPHWRRPAPDAVIDFCESKGIRVHGHPLYWVFNKWMLPQWLPAKLPKAFLDARPVRITKPEQTIPDHILIPWYLNELQFSNEQLSQLFSDYAIELHTLMMRRFAQIAFRYGSRVQSWDVCNEAGLDFENGLLKPNLPICKTRDNHLMPGDYVYRAFKLAESLFPETAKFNINDFHLQSGYVDLVRNLQSRTCRVDIMGAQIHRFDPKTMLAIAAGETNDLSPAWMQEKLDLLSQANVPLHLSEITLTSPSADAQGEEIQATLARDLYRLWFSTPLMMGITWWNSVDGCGAAGEPAASGLFTREMKPKASYEVLKKLICHDWQTHLTEQVDTEGHLTFRGFRGTYRLSWKDAHGNPMTSEYHLA